MSDPNTNTPAPAPHGLLDGDVFFGAEADDADGETGPGMPAPQPEVNPEVAKLQGTVDALSKQLEQMQQDRMTLMMQPHAAPPVPLALPKPLEALPDVITEPEAYADSVAKRIEDRLDARAVTATAVAAKQQESTARYNNLWEAFQVKHKEYAGDYRQVQYAANIAAQNITKRGLDVERYMFTYQDQFMQDVITEMESIFGKKGGKPEPLVEPEPGRTGGMFGGEDSGGKPEPAMVPDNAFAEIREWQEKTGFHR